MFCVEEIKSLNELELAVYEYIMQHKSAVPYMRIRELAAEAHVSTSTVLRFCKKMGCDGYAEFKLRMKEWNGLKQVTHLSEDLSEIRAFLAASTVAVILSVSGESEQVVKIANGLKRSNRRIISITDTEQSTIILDDFQRDQQPEQYRYGYFRLDKFRHPVFRNRRSEKSPLPGSASRTGSVSA